MKQFFILVVIFLLYTVSGISQYTYDHCQYARFIEDSNHYCSAEAEFSNEGATPDPEFPHPCVSLKFKNGVWFSFIPTHQAVSIRVFSGGQNGTMVSPKILLFEDCNTFLTCSPGKSATVDELVVDQLILGKTYYIMIESSVGGEGSFKLCIDEFTPVPSPESDCDKAVILCDKSPFVVQHLTGIGEDTDEIEPGICLREELASSWYKWTCDQAGTLTFTLTPNNNDETITDDLDFAVYELPNGLYDCTDKKILRCMASGANLDANGNLAPLSSWASCNGPTGLREGERDISEDPGCHDNSNNFVAPLNMESGKSYVLIINNFSRSGQGFSIEFGGTGTFLGPEADFEAVALDRFECDKTIQFINKSKSKTDTITDYIWHFGNGAVPLTANDKGPVDVIYDSFGDKIVALTVKSSRGCQVTKLLNIFVNPCCADFSLDVDATATDPVCYGDSNATILGLGSGGNPPYMYSLDDSRFQTIPIFYDLDAGDYTLYVRDRKGCIDSIEVDIENPEELIADAGEDQTIDLGDHTNLNGDYSPRDFDVSYHWSPNYHIEDTTDLHTSVYPYHTQTYTLTVTQDSTGCTATDDVTIFVTKKRIIEIPNVFTPNGDGYNDMFTAFNVKAGIRIETMKIFDRWGELIFETHDIPLGDLSQGWDGTYKGQKVNPGVYVYLIEVRFLDDEVIPFAGDITVLN